MKTISMVIPCYTLNKELEDLALIAGSSYLDQVDELIIVEDGGMFSPKLQALADIYIHNKDNKGFSKAVNQGVKICTKEYVMVVNSDTVLREGDLQDLCIEDIVTSPATQNQEVPMLAGHFFVVPWSIVLQRGLLDERAKNFASDANYEARVADIFQQVPSVTIYHELNRTINVAGLTEEDVEKDRQSLQ
jgi:glycosyltransferase involved in cell wall biosynthesis